MPRKYWYVVFLIGALLFLVGAGRFYFSLGAVDRTSKFETTRSTPTPIPSPTPTLAPTPATCTEEYNAKLNDPDSSYERGVLIVAFVEGRDFPTARSVLATYGLIAQDPEHAEEYYGYQRLITVKVAQGSEAQTLCILKRDPNIRTVSFSTLFELHQ